METTHNLVIPNCGCGFVQLAHLATTTKDPVLNTHKELGAHLLPFYVFLLAGLHK